MTAFMGNYPNPIAVVPDKNAYMIQIGNISNLKGINNPNIKTMN